MNEDKVTDSGPCPECGADQCCGHTRTVHFGTESFEVEPCARCGGAADLRLDSVSDTDHEHSTFSVFCIKCFNCLDSCISASSLFVAVKCWNETQQDQCRVNARRSEAAVCAIPLKPCPFCGAQPEVLPSSNPDEEGFYVCCVCKGLKTCAETFVFPSAGGAAIAWNTRVKQSLFPAIPEYLNTIPSWVYLFGSLSVSIGFALKDGLPYFFSAFGTLSMLAAFLIYALQSNSHAESAEETTFDKSLPRCPSCGDFPAVKRTPSGCFNISCSNDHCWGQRNCDQRFLKKEDAAAYWRGFVASRSEKEA